MSLLVRDNTTIRLQDHWPTQDDLGLLVLMPGGEAGILTSWWHAPDHSEWRWQLELSATDNHPKDTTMVPTTATALATTRVGDLHREAQVSPWTLLVMDRRQDGDHTHPHDNAHPKVPDLRRPARPRPAFVPVTWRAAHTMDDP